MTPCRAGRAAALVLVLSSAVGCTGDDSQPDGDGAGSIASTAQFCGAVQDFQADLVGSDPSQPTVYATTLEKAATRLDAVGLPANAPTGARAGFQARIATITALPDDPTAQDIAAIGKPGKAEKAQLAALDAFIAATCPP